MLQSVPDTVQLKRLFEVEKFGVGTSNFVLPKAKLVTLRVSRQGMFAFVSCNSWAEVLSLGSGVWTTQKILYLNSMKVYEL